MKQVAPKPITVTLVIKNYTDTGVGITILFELTWNKYFHSTENIYTKKLEVLGEREVTVEYDKICKWLIVTIVKGDEPNLVV